ncbi:uncharacterized protein MONBRDRAFT_35597 [Monosiga brevicollis MX1]|uniref:Carboxylesterase type B domain-containing protein n=1 Tax=Monosiga brevicollis TaxID=81824 RepID=A9UQ69_MONBE|nr:uncharacterized protein MONBRDRAFT_35597 [Monosiga brevicollis MX1]EDQ92544.1 predicted protein [Monosiga brevicollis MX1]|eukprot:XP_001742306.1 hypothetical protein [Monosiga brevicollis MX1]
MAHRLYWLGALLLWGTLSDGWAQPSVTLSCGRTLHGLTHLNRHSYYGIPFAEPPVGPRRLQPAKVKACPNTDLNATHYGSACLQQDTSFARPQSEDCLNLDMHVPLGDPAAGATTWPTLVWVYGGSNTGGSTNDYMGLTNIVPLAEACVVTMNYRTGALGFLAVDALVEGDERRTAGNYGLTDIVASLEWVQANANAFRCSTSNVTIYGQSSGGTNILALLTNPAHVGLFSAAYALSASTRQDFSREHAASMQMPYLNGTVCRDLQGFALAHCLRAVADPRDLIMTMPDSWDLGIHEVAPGVPNDHNENFVPLNIVDGVTVPMTLQAEYAMALSRPYALDFEEPAIPYPFHLWDWIVLQAAWDMFLPVYQPSTEETRAHDLLVQFLHTFARGQSTLAPFNDGVVNVIDNTTQGILTPQSQYKAARCARLVELGINASYWWIN